MTLLAELFDRLENAPAEVAQQQAGVLVGMAEAGASVRAFEAAAGAPPAPAVPAPPPAPAAERTAEATSEPQRFIQTAATASPTWLATRDSYVGHLMTCRACHAPTGRYCPTGAELRATYNNTPWS